MSEHIYETIITADGVVCEILRGKLVRCKDCKWRDEPGCALRIVDESDKPGDYDFCSFGERKEQEE